MIYMLITFVITFIGPNAQSKAVVPTIFYLELTIMQL